MNKIDIFHDKKIPKQVLIVITSKDDVNGRNKLGKLETGNELKRSIYNCFICSNFTQ